MFGIGIKIVTFLECGLRKFRVCIWKDLVFLSEDAVSELYRSSPRSHTFHTTACSVDAWYFTAAYS